MSLAALSLGRTRNTNGAMTDEKNAMPPNTSAVADAARAERVAAPVIVPQAPRHPAPYR